MGPRDPAPWPDEAGVVSIIWINAHTPTVKAYAIVQLRQDNALGTLYNMVGFQTKLKHGAQTDVFRMIPGLQDAVFARLGGLHRNTFLNSPRLLDGQLRLKADPRLRFAGQITGVEGYVESAAMGLLTGRLAAAERLGRTLSPHRQPRRALGYALVEHITGGHLAGGKFQPMNINYGLLHRRLSGAFASTRTAARSQQGPAAGAKRV